MAAAAAAAAGRFGRLWGRGHERLLDRRVIQVVGPGATPYLQNLVTSNLLQAAPTPPRPEPIHTTVPGVPKKRSSLRQQQTEPSVDPPPNGISTSIPSQQNGYDSEITNSSTEVDSIDTDILFNDQLRSTCFLDPKGRVITDSLVWKVHDDHFYLDVPGNTADGLLQHLQHYKLRKTKVQVTDCTSTVHSYVVYGTLATAGTPTGYLAGLDPRHPSLGMRVLQLPPPAAEANADVDEVTPAPSFSELMASQFPEMPGNYELVRRLAGVAEGREIAGKVCLETNQELLNAVSFDKGCYLGQELTARVHHTGVLRKRILPILLQDAYTQVPHPWMVASSLQTDRRNRTFTKAELATLPSRLPRLSVLTAGNLVALTTGSVHPNQAAVDAEAASELAAAMQKTATWMKDLELACSINDSINTANSSSSSSNSNSNSNDTCSGSSGSQGIKMIDTESGMTIGQILSPPVKGTNVVLALMRLESVGLLQGGVWSKTNKVSINDKEFRYLPYLPLWWPELSMATGKAKTEHDRENEEEKEARLETNDSSSGERRSPLNTPPGMTRVEIEEINAQ